MCVHICEIGAVREKEQEWDKGLSNSNQKEKIGDLQKINN